MKRRFFLSIAILILAAAFARPEERRCSLCGSVIPEHDAYFQVKGGKEVYCERCYREAPRCSLCKLPTAADDIDPGTGACPKCLAKLPRCQACGKPITGKYYKFESAKGVYCPECKNTRPACAICGVPVGNRYWEYPDGRIACSDCGEHAVFDPRQIETIVRIVRETVERRLGLKVTRPYTVTVQQLSGVGVPRNRDGEKAAAGTGALYGKELGLYRYENGKSEIILLIGLPPDLLYEAAAHEYAHAWQMENGMSSLEPELMEGFAQWVAAFVLREKGFHGALERLEARADFPYGTGYQRLNAMHRNIIMELIRQRR